MLKKNSCECSNSVNTGKASEFYFTLFKLMFPSHFLLVLVFVCFFAMKSFEYSTVMIMELQNMRSIRSKKKKKALS